MSKDQEMDLIEHLTELRKRIIWVLVIFIIALAIGFLFARPIIFYLKTTEPASGFDWHVFSPWEPLRIYLNVAFIFGLVLALPFALYQVWAFVKPGLRPIEQKAAALYIPFAFLLCLAGLAFGYFVVFPAAFGFTMMLSSSLHLTETIGGWQYFSFMFNIIIPLSLLFELPVVVMFLTKLRILNPAVLNKFRRISYLLLVILSTMITPPDIVSPIIVAVPMVLLYELSVILSRIIYKKQLEQDEQWAEEEEPSKELPE